MTESVSAVPPLPPPPPPPPRPVPRGKGKRAKLFTQVNEQVIPKDYNVFETIKCLNNFPFASFLVKLAKCS